MNSKLFCRSASSTAVRMGTLLLGACLFTSAAFAGKAQAPEWVHSAATQPMPAHDDKVDAVVLYSSEEMTVDSSSHTHGVVRQVLKILRPDGREHGVVYVPYGKSSKVVHLRGWCIPASGDDYEVKDKDWLDIAPPGVRYGELVNDLRYKVISIPAAEVGNVIAFEYEVEEDPLVLQDTWSPQLQDPVRETHYRLNLPPSWEYKATWSNGPDVKPTASGNSYEWVLHDVPALNIEQHMPPFRAVATHMVVSMIAPGGSEKTFNSWEQMGNWYNRLLADRLSSTPEIDAQVASLTAGKTTQLAKMQALARFAQADVRYVAIELGIGGWQPHAASEVFKNRFGDCKDKATLLRTMLKQIGVESYHVSVNVRRGAADPKMQASVGIFNHVITAIRLPAGVDDVSLFAIYNHPKLGRLLFFDPTNEFVPFGELPDYEQASYGLLTGPDGGEMVQLPREPSSLNGIRRTAKATLDATGGLKATFDELRFGSRAAEQRDVLQSADRREDRTKAVENLLSHSFSAYTLTYMASVNAADVSQPFGYKYSATVPNYAKYAGDLLLVRPRLVGSRSSALLEDKEPRKQPVVFEGPELDNDVFEITIPPGYVVDDVPPPMDADFPFASYHSKTTVEGNVIRYQRSFEVKDLRVDMNQMDDLKKFYRMIASDERSTAVLKPGASSAASTLH